MDDESRLILKVQEKNSKKAADLLVRKYYKEIYVFVYRQVGNKEDSMDLTQEIFISMLKTIVYFDRSKSSFRTWLYRIATNKVIDHRRRYKPQLLSTDEIEIEDTTDYQTKFQQSEMIRRIEEYVCSFDDTSQQVFRLHIYDDRSFREIGESLSLPEATVKTKYYRLQKKIREEFGDNEI